MRLLCVSSTCTITKRISLRKRCSSWILSLPIFFSLVCVCPFRVHGLAHTRSRHTGCVYPHVGMNRHIFFFEFGTPGFLFFFQNSFSCMVFIFFFSFLFFTTRGPVPSNVTTNPIVKGPKTRSFRFVLECWWDGADTKDVNCLFFSQEKTKKKKGSLSKRESVVVVNGFFFSSIGLVWWPSKRPSTITSMAVTVAGKPPQSAIRTAPIWKAHLAQLGTNESFSFPRFFWRGLCGDGDAETCSLFHPILVLKSIRKKQTN